MRDTTKLYSLNPVCMSLMFIQGQRVSEKLELVLKGCMKQLMFMMVDFVKGGGEGIWGWGV